MEFKEVYTTDRLKLQNMETEKDKVVISEEAYLQATMIQNLINMINMRGRK